MPTLTDIAKQARVSTSTVSRVLNNHPAISDAKREAVLKAARNLQYPLTSLRRSPQMPRSVLVTGTGEDDGSVKRQSNNLAGTEFSRLVLEGAQAVFQQNGIVTFTSGSHSSITERGNKSLGLNGNIPQYANVAGLAGFIVVGGQLHEDLIRSLRASNLPFVIAGARPRSLRLNCVAADYAYGIEQAVTYLASIGKKIIGLVNGPTITTTSEEKYRGFRLALSLHNLAFAPNQVVADVFTADAGYAKTLQLLTQRPDLNAIVYADDFMAVGGLHALKELGRHVPDDVAVIGYHDYDIARFTDPPLTTVHFDMRRIGAIAAHRLCMTFDDPHDEPWLLLEPTYLEVRKSA